MKRFSLAFAVCLGVGCNNGGSPGVVQLAVYVIDAVSGAPLCNAVVTANNVPMTLGGEAPECYFTPTNPFTVGQTVTITVSDTGHVTTTETDVIKGEGNANNITVQLSPLDADAGLDASADGSDGSTEDALSNDASADADALDD